MATQGSVLAGVSLEKKTTIHFWNLTCWYAECLEADLSTDTVLLLFFGRSVVSDSVSSWTAVRQSPLSFTISWSLLLGRFKNLDQVYEDNKELQGRPDKFDKNLALFFFSLILSWNILI